MRHKGLRTTRAALLLVCAAIGMLTVAAATASGAGTPLTAANQQTCVSILDRARNETESGWTIPNIPAGFGPVRARMKLTREIDAQLHQILVILSGHDLGTADPVTPIKAAETDLDRAAVDLARHHPQLARSLVSQALRQERKARTALDNVPTGPSTGGPTVSGSLSPGSAPGTWIYALTTSGAANAYELIAPSGVSITSRFAPQGLSCSNGTAPNILFCLGTVPPAFTGIIAATSPTLTISAAVSIDGGKTFTPPVPLK